MSNQILSVKNLKVKIQGEEKLILDDFNFAINKSEVHVIMGLNGTGKSTLSKSIVGHFGYDVVGGEIKYKDKDLLAMTPEDRANEGVFMSFQNPVEIPGVNNSYFLRSALNAKREYLGEKPLSSVEMLKKIKEITSKFNLNQEMLKRSVNDGFSGGEKKKNELLQMLLLEPELIILDEIDSGLDVDALKMVSDGINSMRNENRSFLIITHYQRVLELIKPDFVHILKDGKIIKTGDYSLALQIESQGYKEL